MRQPVTVIALICGLALPRVALAQQGSVHDRVPATLDARAQYVIYLHGRIIEDRERRPTHEVWGVYEYQQILDALAGNGLVVISEQRASGTDPDQYAAHVADQVKQLLAAGVPVQRIAVVGFSKGGGIAIRASALLHDDRLTFVFLAACGDGDFSRSSLTARGRVLSLYEESDEAGRSCRGLFARPGSGGESTEKRISIGGGHGAFFRPHDEWLGPVLRWVTNSR